MIDGCFVKKLLVNMKIQKSISCYKLYKKNNDIDALDINRYVCAKFLTLGFLVQNERSISQINVISKRQIP